jgi:hypothetical protein
MAHTIQGHSIERQRLAGIRASGRIPQTLLFTGISGIGKKLVAREFLASLYCLSKETVPCLKCENCVRFFAQTMSDYIELVPNEKGNIPIGDAKDPEPGTVRWLIYRLNQRPVSGRFLVVIDGADSLKTEAQNALLKTIEEPVADTCMILIAPSKYNMLSTIVSRSFEISFSPLTEREIAAALSLHETFQDAREDQPAICALAGGSAESALLVCDAEIRQLLFNLCADISASIEDGAPFLNDFTPLAKTISSAQLYTVLLNVYRAMLREKVASQLTLPPQFDRLRLTDTKKIQLVIKIILALIKAESHNVNSRLALKGMLYAAHKTGRVLSPQDVAETYL